MLGFGICKQANNSEKILLLNSRSHVLSPLRSAAQRARRYAGIAFSTDSFGFAARHIAISPVIHADRTFGEQQILQ
jgi:hypothetical protein